MVDHSFGGYLQVQLLLWRVLAGAITPLEGACKCNHTFGRSLQVHKNRASEVIITFS